MEIKTKKSLIAISIILAMVLLPMSELNAIYIGPIIDPGPGGGDSTIVRSTSASVSKDTLTLRAFVMSTISGSTQTITVTISGYIHPAAQYLSSVLIAPQDDLDHELAWPNSNYFYFKYPNYFKQNQLLDAAVANQEIKITNLLYDGYFSITFTLIPEGSYIVKQCRIYLYLSVTFPGSCVWKNVYLNCV